MQFPLVERPIIIFHIDGSGLSKVFRSSLALSLFDNIDEYFIQVSPQRKVAEKSFCKIPVKITPES